MLSCHDTSFQSDCHQECVTEQQPARLRFHHSSPKSSFWGNDIILYIRSSLWHIQWINFKQKNLDRHRPLGTTWAHLEAQFVFQFILSFELCEACVRAAARFTVAVSTVSPLISPSLCLYAFLCVELAKQAHLLRTIHSSLLSPHAAMATVYDRQKNKSALSELQSTWTLRSMNALLLRGRWGVVIWRRSQWGEWEIEAEVWVRWHHLDYFSHFFCHARLMIHERKCVRSLWWMWRGVQLCFVLTEPWLIRPIDPHFLPEINICSRNGTRLRMSCTERRWGKAGLWTDINTCYNCSPCIMYDLIFHHKLINI